MDEKKIDAMCTAIVRACLSKGLTEEEILAVASEFLSVSLSAMLECHGYSKEAVELSRDIIMELYKLSEMDIEENK